MDRAKPNFKPKQDQKTLTKVLRLEIVKPVDGDWKSVGDDLHELQRITSKILNYCVRRYYLVSAPVVEEIIKAGKKPSKKDLPDIRNELYAEVSKNYSALMSSAVYAQLTKIAYDRFNNDWFKIMVKGEVSLPSYRNSGPIYIAKLKEFGVNIYEKENDKYIERYLAVQYSPKENNRVRAQEFILHSKAFQDNNKLVTWNRLLSGEYKLGMVQLIYSQRKHKWFANLSYSFTPKIVKELDPRTRIGVDLGLSVPVYLAVNNGFARASLREEGESIQSFRRQLEKRRRRLRSNEKGILERRSGHGRAHKIGSIEKLRDLEGNFRRTANHRLSRGVINFALKQNAGVIVIEDLEGYTDQKSQDAFLKTWTYFELQTMIEQKAKEVGIAVEKIKPSYTSQRCSKCGHIDEKKPGRQKLLLL